MSRYLEMLKTGKRSLSDPPKPPKVPFSGLGGFGGCPGGYFSKNERAANDPTTAPTLPDDCASALQSADGGLYLPWGAYLDPASVNRMRGELVALIEELADLEQWDSGRRDDVLTRAIRGPLADLMPNLAHFNERLTEARAEKEARALSESRSFRVTDAVLRARGYL